MYKDSQEHIIILDKLTAKSEQLIQSTSDVSLSTNVIHITNRFQTLLETHRVSIILMIRIAQGFIRNKLYNICVNFY